MELDGDRGGEGNEISLVAFLHVPQSGVGSRAVEIVVALVNLLVWMQCLEPRQKNKDWSTVYPMKAKITFPDHFFF